VEIKIVVFHVDNTTGFFPLLFSRVREKSVVDVLYLLGDAESELFYSKIAFDGKFNLI
jgi:hypothetical protein